MVVWCVSWHLGFRECSVACAIVSFFCSCCPVKTAYGWPYRLLEALAQTLVFVDGSAVAFLRLEISHHDHGSRLFGGMP